MLPIGHTTALFVARFSPDGNRVLTASHDKTAKVWDANSGDLLADLQGHADYVYAATFSPDGKRILTGSHDNTAKIWDAASGVLLSTLKGHTNEILGIQCSKNGKNVITCSKDYTARVWSALTGKELILLKGHDSSIQTVCFNPGENRLLTASYDGTAIIWDAKNGVILKRLQGHTGPVYSAVFSHNGKFIVTASDDSTAIVWDAVTGKLLRRLKGESNLWMAIFSADDKQVVTASFAGTSTIWDASGGNIIHNLTGHTASIWDIKFSPNNRQIITASDDRTAKIWDASTGKLIRTIAGHSAQVRTCFFSSDGRKIVTASNDRTAKIWDSNTGELLKDLKGYTSGLWSVQLNSDRTKILAAAGDKTAKILDIKTGSILYELKGHTDSVITAMYSPDWKKIVTISKDKTAKLWDGNKGFFLADMKKHTGKINTVQFSPDGQHIATGSDDSTIKIWNANNGVFLYECKGKSAGIITLQYSHDGKKIITISRNSIANIWDAASGIFLVELKGHTKRLFSASFSPDDKQVVTSGMDTFAITWDAITGKQLNKLSGHTLRIPSAAFSYDGKKIVTASWDNTAIIWDAASGSILQKLVGHTFALRSAAFTEDGLKVTTVSRDNSAKIWDVATGAILKNLADQPGEVASIDFKDENADIVTSAANATISIWDQKTGDLRYTFFTVGNGSDFLVVDKYSHYDGSEAAKKLLYFTCGTEVISLDQVKEKLWVPRLAERIMNNDIINDAKLSELDICSFTPLIEKMDKGINDFRFQIIPRRGGLGETVLNLNGMEVKRYKPVQLKKEGNSYFLTVNKDLLKDNYIPGADNPLTLKSYTAGNDISSRGLTVFTKSDQKVLKRTVLYAVIIGVSQYKSEELNLRFPEKDAQDLAIALGVSARKLFDSQHVNIYDLTTNIKHYKHPDKKSIRQTFEEISSKSKPEDLLLIFFAGHGVMGDAAKPADKKKFYFLTADASESSRMSSLSDVGISMDELTGWIDPARMKAQKRILIFDACNSGQAINDMQSYAGTFNIRGDDEKFQQIKAINKLNEQSGLFILSASASNQNAYEMSRYGHGLLTYALLSAIKLRPDILMEDKYLDVSRWFNAGRDIVSSLSKENGARQEPQLITNTNFNIGMVDEQVIASIKLADEKPVFTNSNFQNNDESIADDDLEISKYLDQQLNKIASRGFDEAIVYNGQSKDPNAWTLSGRYELKQDDVFVRRINIKQGKTTKHNFEVSGKRSDPGSLAAEVVSRAIDWVIKNGTK